MKNTDDTWQWINENGISFNAERVESLFDKWIKVVIRRSIKDIVQFYIRQVANFPVQPDDILINAATTEMVSNAELIEVRLYTALIYVSDEKLAKALQRLKPREKALIEMDFVFGYSDEDISKYLHIGKESVYTFRYRILRKLELLMEGSRL